MKPITSLNFLFACIVTATTLSIPQLVKAQLPQVVDGTQTSTPETETPVNPEPITTASASGLKVSCQDLKTVVQKGEREAVMVTWNYDGFGKDFSPAKRCQVVSERLQQVADLNGGTFKDLQLATGVVNSQPVVCALQSNGKKCNRQNLLFTLKPENARNPDAVIQKIFSFAQDGSSSLNESSSQKSYTDMNLGNWEQKAFSQSTKKSRVTNAKRRDTGF